MYRVLCLLVLGAAAGCYSNQSIDETEQVAVAAPAENLESPDYENDGVMEARRDIEWEQIEVFDFSKAKVNQKLPLYTTRRHFEAAWGSADTVFVPDYDNVCAAQFDDEFSYAYVKGSRFEVCRDSVVCDLFAFQPGTTLSYGNITLSANTTWEEAAKLFPMAAQQAENEGKTDVITLRESPDGDAGLRLHFVNGRLATITYNLPC
jgi:hypothetical protein